MKTSISVLILTYNEEKHIKRCIESVKSIASEVFIVDSFSDDNTIEIARDLGAKVYQHKWTENYAAQFQWGLENCPISSKWVLRLDADEYLLPELVNEIQEKLDLLPQDVTGIVFKRRHYFLNKWMKHGIYPVKLLRLFKYGKAKIEERWMDEHIQLFAGDCIEFDNDFVDNNLNNLFWFINKHNKYAIREAIDLLDMEIGGISKDNTSGIMNDQAAEKRNLKKSYLKHPLFLRSFIYFIYRYIFRLGFLDGKEGFLWHFLHAWWYRTMVDVTIFEIKIHCGKDIKKIKKYIYNNYQIEI